MVKFIEKAADLKMFPDIFENQTFEKTFRLVPLQNCESSPWIVAMVSTISVFVYLVIYGLNVFRNLMRNFMRAVTCCVK